jgi:hypothetical protein
VLDPARHLASLARFVATRPLRGRRDPEVLRELETGGLDLPPGLEIEWLGVAGYRIACEGEILVVDPYLSRASLGKALADTAVVALPLVPNDAGMARE